MDSINLKAAGKIAMIFAFVIALCYILFLLFWKLWFLRDPERKIPKGRNIVSPADGKIMRIIKIGSSNDAENHHNTVGFELQKGFGKYEVLTNDVPDAGYIISIFMNPFDVHVNRAPIAGEVVEINYEKGRFLAANSLDVSLENEKNEILIRNSSLNFTVKVIQVAGFLARRIECWVKLGDEIAKGDKIGRINLGSQVTLVLPKNIELKVKKGMKVYAGSTVIADIADNKTKISSKPGNKKQKQ